MGFIWREWRNGPKAGVSGWDPCSTPAIGMVMIGVLGAIILFSLAIPWFYSISVLALGVGCFLTFRYHLIISPNGYRLWRTCCFIPWSVRTYSKQAIVFVEDDWGVDFSLAIDEPKELSFEQLMELIPSVATATLFGTEFACRAVVFRIHSLAFRVGCTDKPPGEDPSAVKEIKLAVPNMPRRLKWLRRRNKNNENR